MKKIITIDGPSGVGKTSIGKKLQLNLTIHFFQAGSFIDIFQNIPMKRKNINTMNLN
tara:strand:- start:401 stop:571 length:171 start_codon:yes stop_codon:yes gene_type:complete